MKTCKKAFQTGSAITSLLLTPAFITCSVITLGPGEEIPINSRQINELNMF
jgi:hypothetical protein